MSGSSRSDNQSRLLLEVMRQAELRLDAQLTAGIAADARAMQFLAFIAAIIVLLITAAIAAVGFTVFGHQTIAICVAGSLGFSVAGYHAYHAAKPIPFEFPGSYPSAWGDDISNDVSFDDAVVEQLAYYDRNLNRNRAAAEESAKALRASASAVLVSVIGCAALSFALLTAQLVSLLPSAG